ncbi:hypothetical protein AAFC00_006998 [Neodothiora populina]|uniref:Cellular morphogenesis protein n=1 Tax=Neodothiora populina TaxID=2781224 RepID=A0ABR3PD48_9PEZI
MRGRALLSSPYRLAALLITSLPGLQAVAQSSVPSPNLDLSNLGRVALAGNFDSVSFYTYEGQNEDTIAINGSQWLLSQYPNGDFQNLVLSDAYITTMCPFLLKDGTLEGVVVGGNFTSLGGVETQGIALFNPNTSKVTPLPGLSGSVNSVYCDQDASMVYVGGSFTGGNSTNAIAWTTGWTNLPFAGFNGPVSSITKSANGSIVFGGTFTGLGNATTPKDRDMQVINLSAGNITSRGSTSTSGFSDPSNIVCKTGAQAGTGNTWLLSDNTAGYWNASFGFGFNPTKLRLYNAVQGGRGTKTFRFTAAPSHGIMNLTYFDSNGQQQYCSALCPLPENNSTYQDFHFVNVIGMDGFQIDLSAWYGSGGGLSGIELFQDDIYAFAVPDFNEPRCDDVSTGANSTATGPWKHTPSGSSTSDYLTANLESDSSDRSNASVVFRPDIKQSGNYSITLYTPGCINDDTCSSRGIVNVTGTATADGATISTTLYQTNDFDKYDQIYYGYVDLNSDTFRPTITLAPAAGQPGDLTVVAQRVRFELLSSTGGLNGIFEYNPNEAIVATDFASSPIDAAGMNLDFGAVVKDIALDDGALYVVGNFSATGESNVLSVTDGNNATSLPGNGLNSEILVMYQNGSMLYMGGNFTNTADNDTQGLNRIAAFSTSDKAWQNLGAGVNGPVWSIVPLQLNVTSEEREDVLIVNGGFSEVLGFGSNGTYAANGVAVWVPSRKNWLHNLAACSIEVEGGLTAQTNVPGLGSLYAGSFAIRRSGMKDAVSLSGSGLPALQPLGVTFDDQQSSSSLSKRATTTAQNITGVAAGIFYVEKGLNITILGGHFTANATDGSTINNLAILDDTNDNQTVTGLPNTISADSQFLAMDTMDSKLYAGGVVSGTANDNDINGLIVYDLVAGALTATQPPGLSGDSVSVNAVASQPSSSMVYIGGSFSNAGSLSCETLCMYDTSTMQWMSVGAGISGSVSSMVWSSNNELVLAGNLTVNGNATTMAIYDAKSSTFKEIDGASTLPGPITALAPANAAYDEFWVAGTNALSNNSYFLSKYDGNNWTSVAGLDDSTSIRGLQLMGVTSNHESSSLVDSNKVLLITGSIRIPSHGSASAVLFNGTSFQPLVLTNLANGGQSSLARMFVQNPGNFLTTSTHHMDRGFVVLIALAIALALIFLLVVAGIIMERYRRRKEGYQKMRDGGGAGMRADQTANLTRIPPESLFGTLREKDPAPKI